MTRFIGVDWGSSRIRAYRIADGRAVDMRDGDDGLKPVPPGGFADVLDRYLDGWSETRVLLSGMVTSRTGWVETPYSPCPAMLADLARGAVVRRTGGRDLHFLPGVSHGDGSAMTEVMRGEEVQLLGLS